MNEKLEMEILDYNNLKELEDIGKNPVIQTLLSLIPGISDGVKAAIEMKIYETQKKKIETVCDLIFTDINVTSDMLMNVDFIIEFLKMIDVVNKLSSNEKIKYIAKLFRSSFIESPDYNTSEFEEFLYRINDLSLREIDILVDLYNNFDNIEKFYKIEMDKFMLNRATVNSILSGISRSGFCSEMSGGMFLGHAGGYFSTTTYFENFIKKLGLRYITPEERKERLKLK